MILNSFKIKKEDPEKYKELSSGNSLVKLKTYSAILFTYIENKRRPATDPWDTPAVTTRRENELDFVITFCSLFDK